MVNPQEHWHPPPAQRSHGFAPQTASLNKKSRPARSAHSIIILALQPLLQATLCLAACRRTATLSLFVPSAATLRSPFCCSCCWRWHRNCNHRPICTGPISSRVSSLCTAFHFAKAKTLSAMTSVVSIPNQWATAAATANASRPAACACAMPVTRATIAA